MTLRVSAALGLSAICLIALPTLVSAGYIGVQVKLDDNGKGIHIIQVLDDGAAKKAGLKAGDVITHIDGTAYSELKAFIDKIKDTKVDESLEFLVLRDDKEVKIKVKVGELP